MTRVRLISLVLISLLALSTAGCRTEASPVTPASSVPSPSATPAPTAPPTPTIVGEPTPEPTESLLGQLEEMDPSDFGDPTRIDNPWLPMKPGTQWIYEGSTEESGLIIPHRIVFTVTGLTKVINDVQAVVAYVVDYSNNQAIEKEIAFYAQDDEGRVWYLGEYPEEYENGLFENAPAWIAGLKGARAGIKMLAEPREGTPSYSQGWGPAVNWTDRGRVDEMGLETCVPVDCYQDVLVIAETSLEELDAFQLKYYARGVGEVRVGWRGADANKETLELVELNHLSPEALAEVHAEVFEQEARAYEISKEVYENTPPLEPAAGTLTVGREAGQDSFLEIEGIEPATFSDPTRIDNQWLPLAPGNQWILEGQAVEDGVEIPHRVVFTVTDLVKEIAGVPSVVVWIEDYAEEELVEGELAFYAQDDNGNIWYLGEYPEEYEGGEIVDTPAWIAGVDGAKAGIQMQAEPEEGPPSYAQGWGPAVSWTDRAQVNKLITRLCVALDCFEDVLMIDEFDQEEPGAFQLKYYARDIGPVKVGWRGADAQQENLELVEFSQLDASLLAKARTAALALEERAYTLSEDVFGKTPPAEQLQP